MNTVAILEKLREKKVLTKEEIEHFVNGAANSSLPEYQLGAFLMAVYLNGLSSEETFYLTEAVMRSGDVLEYEPGSYVVDKHSTGGIGDKTSFLIAPICAAYGLRVPMISGRALGFTGGTLDKLESIPGMNVSLTKEEFQATVKKIGLSIVGQTGAMAPADKKLYLLRGFTATVESIPLITASIMGKKLAAGISGLILDVKTGSGAFMAKKEDAFRLAHSMVNTGKLMGKRIGAFITRMEGPLGNEVGNHNEISESLHLLTPGSKKTDAQEQLYNLCLELSAVPIYFNAEENGNKISRNDALILAKEQIENGNALEKFKEMIKEQGGDLQAFLAMPEEQKNNYTEIEIKFSENGYLNYCNSRAIGWALAHVAGGRINADDKIDPLSAFHFPFQQNDKVSKYDVYCRIRYNKNCSDEHLTQMQKHLNDSFELMSKAGEDSSLIIEKVLE